MNAPDSQPKMPGSSLKEQQNKIALAVRQAYVALKQAEAKVELTESKVNEARENLRITQLLFEADMATNVEVLSAQNQYTQSQIDSVQAILTGIDLKN